MVHSGQQPIRLACDMSAIPADAREEHSRVTRTLAASAIEIRESVDEIALFLPSDAYGTAAQFVANERLCCPFLRFVLEVSPGPGPMWLRISGPVGVTGFLRAELQLPVPHG